MDHSKPSLTALSFALLAAGCAFEERQPAASLARALAVDNGRNLNGRNLNGRELDDRSLDAVSLDGVRLGGVALDGAWLEGSALHGAVGNKELRPRQFVGATVRGILDDGASLALRIDEVLKSPEPADKDVWLYTVSYPSDEGRMPLCGLDGEGVPVPATALAGRWDYRSGVEGGGSHIADKDSYTFACIGYALAKCVYMGYKPWRTAKRCDRHGDCVDVSLEPYHQACTRLLRADYCGDGTSYTVDDTLIDLYDGLGIQKDTEGWSFEAEWDGAGGRCVSGERIASMAPPPCASRLTLPECGDLRHFRSGTLLMSEYQ